MKILPFYVSLYLLTPSRPRHRAFCLFFSSSHLSPPSIQLSEPSSCFLFATCKALIPFRWTFKSEMDLRMSLYAPLNDFPATLSHSIDFEEMRKMIWQQIAQEQRKMLKI